MDDPHDTFSGWLRTSLAERGISQRQLAHRSGVHHTTISRLIRERRMPSHQTALRLTRALESGPLSAATLRAALRRDAYLTETDVARIVGLYRELHARRRTERHHRRRSSN